ncbi:phage portal protein, lambda family [Bradyrhizobium sp. Ghvi]|uniref:phage portal protein n=1 Tax=Bradyrhizobium sp. Ghvi TaxID=1855319 RepID=UPI0008E1DEDB|nr:phage portal protein [Bradyrhizobium sp. Ghvi]SFO17855.1 phage portal protein, lambda family [Bradyrhizobium sp. Ghvi]
MAIADKFRAFFGASAKSLAIIPPLEGVTAPSAGILDGTDGKPSTIWARYSNGLRPMTSGYLNGWQPFYGTPGSEISRERGIVSQLNLDLLFSNPVVSTLVENYVTYAVGNGLTLSSRPCAEMLGISPEEARSLAHQIETAWTQWCNSATEADASGRHSLHQLAAAGFRSYLLTGETLFTLDWVAARGARTQTKVCLLDSRQLDQSITRVAEGNGNASIMQGVQFDQNGRLQGYHIRKFILGSFASAPQAQYVAATTSWGRPRVGHLFDLLVPGQVRGMSPLAAALTPAHSKATLREFSLASALVQSMLAVSIESDLPREQALGSLNAEDPLAGIVAPKGVSPEDWAKAKIDFYNNVKVDLNPGVINHLLRGDKMHVHRPQAPSSTYADFDASLAREAAKASGGSAEDVSGDYSKTSFSASRLALELPWRINLRRRQNILERIYQSTFTAWLEEACETGRIKLPKGAPAFWQCPEAYTAAAWRGSAKPVADQMKAAEADALEISSGLSTLEEKLGERGLDLETVIAQRKAERDMLVEAGLNGPAAVGTTRSGAARPGDLEDQTK